MKRLLILLVLFISWVWAYRWHPYTYEESLDLVKRCKIMYNNTHYDKIIFMDPEPAINKYMIMCLFEEAEILSHKGWNVDRVHAQFRVWGQYGKGMRPYNEKHVNYCLKHDKKKESLHRRAFMAYECIRTYIDRYKMEKDRAETKRFLDAENKRIWEGINNGLHTYPFYFQNEDEVLQAIYDQTLKELREKYPYRVTLPPRKRKLPADEEDYDNKDPIETPHETPHENNDDNRDPTDRAV